MLDADLPESLKEISRVLGRDATLRLAQGLPPCGRRKWRRSLYVPSVRRMAPDHIIVRILGPDAAQALAAKFGGSCLSLAQGKGIALAERNAAIREASRRGELDTSIAERMDLHVWSVRRILKNTTRQWSAKK